MYLIEGPIALLSAIEKEYEHQGLTHKRLIPNILLVHVNPHVALNKNTSLYKALISKGVKIKKLNRQEAMEVLNFKEKVEVKGRKLIIVKRNKNGTVKEKWDFNKWTPDKESLIGKKIRVVEGNLKGFSGIVQEVNVEEGTVKVIFSIFGIPCVETLKLEHVEIISQE